MNKLPCWERSLSLSLSFKMLFSFLGLLNSLFPVTGIECRWWCSWIRAIRRRPRWHSTSQNNSQSGIYECHVGSKRDDLHGIQVWLPCFLFGFSVSRFITCSLVHGIFRLLFIPIPFVLFIVAEETSNMVRKKPNLRIQPRDTIYLGNASSNHITEPHWVTVSSKLHLMSLLDRRQRISPRVHPGDILEITAMLRLSRLFTAFFVGFITNVVQYLVKLSGKSTDVLTWNMYM